MKLAIVDHLINDPDDMVWSEEFRIAYLGEMDDLAKELQQRNIHMDYAATIREFEARFGPLNGYGCLLMHPGIERQREYLAYLRERYPGLRFGILTADPDYYGQTDVPFIPSFDTDKIATFALSGPENPKPAKQ